MLWRRARLFHVWTYLISLGEDNDVVEGWKVIFSSWSIHVQCTIPGRRRTLSVITVFAVD